MNFDDIDIVYLLTYDEWDDADLSPRLVYTGPSIVRGAGGSMADMSQFLGHSVARPRVADTHLQHSITRARHAMDKWMDDTRQGAAASSGAAAP
jgi:hypothetical protein